MAALLRRRLYWRSQIFVRSFRLSPTSVARREGCESYEPGGWNDPSSYKKLVSDKASVLQARLNDPKRFQHIGEREERSLFAAEAVRGIVAGKYLTVYRGMDILKGPEDMIILSQLFWHVKPRTVIEMGTFTGASAIWMADILNLSKIECNLFSVDIDLSLLHPSAKALQPLNLTFMEGDNKEIEKVLSSDFFSAQPHPIIVIEDSHEYFDEVMQHFHHHLMPGDYLVCEDTSPDIPSTLDGGIGVGDGYVYHGLAKLHSWKKFLAKHGDKYAIDTFFSDYFGYNTSSNWDGYARRMKK